MTVFIMARQPGISRISAKLHIFHGCVARGQIPDNKQTTTTNEQTGPVFIEHLKSNVYVTLNAIGSFQCNLCSHWLIQIFVT